MFVHSLTESFAVSGQIAPDDVAEIAAAGFATIVCNRPDHEEAGQPMAEDIARACETHGLEFGYLPFRGSLLPPGLPEAFAEHLRTSSGPVLAYCRSGQRCAYLFMSVQSLLTASE
jgi:uncharacterized protein (TIGR01244 family)